MEREKTPKSPSIISAGIVGLASHSRVTWTHKWAKKEKEKEKGIEEGVGGERDGTADSLGGNLFTPRDGNRLIQGVGGGG